MSTMETTTTQVPDWDVADRLRKALRTADVGVQEMAEYLGVSRNTVSTWINGRIEPKVSTLRLVAMRCGVDYEWLRTGTTSDPQKPTPAWNTDIAEVLNLPVNLPIQSALATAA